MEEREFNHNIKRPDIKSYRKQHITTGVFTGLFMIAAGAVVVMHNLGMVPSGVYGILISWPMLLVVSGVLCAVNRNYTSGIVFMGIGLFCLIPKFTGAGNEWLHIYWPVILVMAGIFLIVKLLVPSKRPKRQIDYTGAARQRSENGFVHIESSLGNYEHIVLDEVFRGGSITATLSGTVLDLRHTDLAEGETYIDIQGTMAGIELYVPEGWEIVSRVRFALGGTDDKRRNRPLGNPGGRRLVLCGNMTLSGIEIKS